ncbi:hypothetical protein V8E52_003049 [Russula decolorans]|jgi:hypothetical protein
MLPEDTLLEIFDIHRRDTMVWSRDGHRWDWLRLAHVCRRWRDVISISPHRLDLWILCKSGGVPIERILGSSSWSSVPLIVRFKASPRNDELILLPDNIAAALRHWDRICEIDLDVTRALAGSIVEVIHESPLQALKSLRVTVENATEPPLLIRNSLLGGSAPHLREIKLDGIAFPFPAVRQVLSSANNLVELHLSNIPNEVYFSPDDLITTLSALVHLKSLTIGFHSPASRPPSITHRPPTSKRTITLSALTHLDFHGASEYLEEFVAQIDDSPSLSKISIKLFNQILFEIPQFCQFVSRLKALALGGYPSTWIFVTHSAESVSVMFVQEGKPSNENYCLGTSCRRLDWQLSFVTQIASQLSPSVLSSVHSLSIKKTRTKKKSRHNNSEMEMPSGGRRGRGDSEEEEEEEEEDVDSAQWLELFQPFRHLTQIHVWEKWFVPGIVQALTSVTDTDTDTEAAQAAAGISVLPELSSLHLSGYRKSPSVAKAAEEFVAARRLAGRTVRLIG